VNLPAVDSTSVSENTDVLIYGENNFDFHRLEEKGPVFESFLGDAGVDVTTTTALDALRADRIPEYDAVVDYLTDAGLTDAQQEGLLGFVGGGGGYVGIHCAADVSSFVDEPNEALERLVGGAFLGHPENATFGVRIVADHPVTAGVDDFEVFDEPYDLRWSDDVTVLAEMDHPDLDVPVVWTRTEGDGRVCYCSLGHTDEAVGHESFQRLVVNAVRWTADRA